MQLPKSLSLTSATYIISFLTLFPSGSLGKASSTGLTTRNKHVKPDIKLFPKDITPGTTVLVPYFTRRSLSKRDAEPKQWSVVGEGDEQIGDLELPRVGEIVELVYGKETSKAHQDPFISTVQLLPPQNRAILVLEEYLLSVLSNVICEDDSTIILQSVVETSSTQTKIKTLNHWLKKIVDEKSQELVVITSGDIMKGCGEKERKAFLVKSITTTDTEIPTSINTLTVSPIEWSIVAKKLSLEFGPMSQTSLGKRSSSENFNLYQDSVLSKRSGEQDEDGIDGNGEVTFDPDIGSRLQLLPVVLPEGVSDLIQFTGIPDNAFSPFLISEGEETPPLTVTCVGCGISGKIGYKGRFDIDTKFPDDIELGDFFDDEDDFGIHVEHAFFTVTILEDLTANLNLEFVIGPDPFAFAFEQSILPPLGNQGGIPIPPGWSIRGIAEAAVFLDLAIGFSLEVNAPKLNATMGGKLTVPKGSSIHWDLVNEDKDESTNWDVSAELTPPTINTITADDNKDPVDTGFSIGANISFIPSATLNVGVLNLVNVGAKLSMQLPELSTEITLVKNVTDACLPPPKDTFFYYPYALLFESGLHAHIKGEIYAEVDLELGPENSNQDQKEPSPTVISAGFTQPFSILSRTLHTFPPGCFVFGDIESWVGQFKNATLQTIKDIEMVLDIDRIESEFKASGKLPDAKDVDWKEVLEEYGDDISSELKKKVQDQIKGSGSKDSSFVDKTGNGDSDNSARQKIASGDGSLWTLAIVALGSGFFKLDIDYYLSI